MIRILCTGDSHTWGQGAEGLLEGLDPPCVAGDLRLAGFGTGGYVNELRCRINQKTGSYVEEWTSGRLAENSGVFYAAPFAILGRTPVRMRCSGAMLRLECGMTEGFSTLGLTIDRQYYGPFCLSGGRTENDYRLFTIHLEDGEHELCLWAEEGTVRFYRLETYGGAYAVINSGVGSTPCFRYQEQFWESHVAAVRPDVVLMEAHTINDWIAGDPPEQYEKRLVRLIDGFRKLGSKVILLTVSPILGEQIFPRGTASYEAYVAASRRAAVEERVILCDANAVMKLCLAGMTENQAMAYLYSDIWHVNDRGHGLYAELAFQALCMLENGKELNSDTRGVDWRNQAVDHLLQSAHSLW